MASVYSASHRNGHRVALKMLHTELSIRSDIRARFLQEGRAANAVKHHGVVLVTDDDVAEDGGAFIVMELLDGEPLETLWAHHGCRLPPKMVLAVGRELCDVMDAAHRAGIVHRDIKPENLFLTNDGELKVLDFGLAHLGDVSKPKMTATGMIFGTPAFMAPEQANGQTKLIDGQTDVWAIGATMFTLLSGEIVHDAESGQAIVVRAATKPARSLASVMRDPEPEIVALVDRALAMDKRARWPSARVMYDEICAVSFSLFGEGKPDLMSPGELTRVGQSPMMPVPPSWEESTAPGRDPIEETIIDQPDSSPTYPRTPKKIVEAWHAKPGRKASWSAVREAIERLGVPNVNPPSDSERPDAMTPPMPRGSVPAFDRDEDLELTHIREEETRVSPRALRIGEADPQETLTMPLPHQPAFAEGGTLIQQRPPIRTVSKRRGIVSEMGLLLRENRKLWVILFGAGTVFIGAIVFVLLQLALRPKRAALPDDTFAPQQPPVLASGATDQPPPASLPTSTPSVPPSAGETKPGPPARAPATTSTAIPWATVRGGTPPSPPCTYTTPDGRTHLREDCLKQGRQ
jgi:serine/threonine protein kinase